VSRKLGIMEQSYYRWRWEYGRLKRLVADLNLDNAIIKEVTRETSEPTRTI